MTVMNVNRGKYIPPTSSQALVLRNGQIVQGEIVKIYPQNKAEIQIGAHRLIAEINTSLMVGKKYFFQVSEIANSTVQLKVLGDSFSRHMDQNITQLLEKLGLKANRQHVQFLSTLLADKIPLNREQLSQAISLLDSSPNRQDAVNLLKEMLVKRLPITENVFNALLTLRNKDLSTSMNQLFTDLSKNPHTNQVQQQLQSLLGQLLSRQEKIDMPFQNRSGNHIHKNELMATLLQQSKQLLTNQPASLTREQFFTQIQQLIFSHGESNFLSTELLHDINSKLKSGMDTIKANAVNILNQFQTALTTSNLTNQQFTLLKQTIQSKIMPFLPEQIQQAVGNLLQQNTKASQTSIYQLLQVLSNDATYSLLETATNTLQHEPSHFHLAAKTRLFSYIQQFMQSIGMQDEHQIRMQIEKLIVNQSDQSLQQQSSIKSLLLQMLQDGNQSLNEKLLPMIHVINGLQLQSVHETQNMIQATLQLPGEKFALPKDLYFEFEGKKTADGKLDPNHCRILFVLQLQHIDETVIDMFIQKRIVSLTIYNDHVKSAQQKSNHLSELLTGHLEALDFHLSTIKWKSLSEHETQQIQPHKKEVQEINQQERFDFRI